MIATEGHIRIWYWRKGEKLTEPMVDPQIWDEIPDSHVVPTVGSSEHDKYADRNSKSKVKVGT